MHLNPSPFRLTNVITRLSLNFAGRPLSVLLTWLLAAYRSVSYVWQLVQLVAEHEPQEELPPIGLEVPSLLLEKEAQEENTRLAPI